MAADRDRQIVQPQDCGPVSIIVEWENADRIGLARADRMLRELYRQMRELGVARSDGHEILIVHDRGHGPGDAATIVEAIAPQAEWPAAIRYVPVADAGYYQQKNLGAAQATNDAFIFLDSDVIPQPGWLAGIFEGLRNPDVEVVCGSTFIECEGFYSSAVALVWFFPTRDQGGGLVKADRFFANNIAFRRDVFEQHNFRDTRQFRGQCKFLADELIAHGHVIWRNRASVVAHPAPKGLKHFLLRALMHGHDERIWTATKGGASLATGTRLLRNDLKRSFARIKAERGKVGLGRTGAVGAMAVGAVYYLLKYIAYLAALVQPGLLGRALAKADA